MKKIIWIFGLPGTGKSELIKNVHEDKNNLRSILNITSDNISYIDVSHDFSKIADEYREVYKRSKLLINKVEEFLDSTNDFLIISGNFVDIRDITENSIISIDKKYPYIEKEIVFLNIEDHDLLYERIKKTDWFQSNYESCIQRYPRIWVDVAAKYLKDKIYDYKELGYKIIEIDTTEGYEVNDYKTNRR